MRPRFFFVRRQKVGFANEKILDFFAACLRIIYDYVMMPSPESKNGNMFVFSYAKLCKFNIYQVHKTSFYVETGDFNYEFWIQIDKEGDATIRKKYGF